ncbi:MmgE/PrpD family protein [Saccharopolyspora spinosa]|uniref:MmgE/PrpD family protein n=1 Tax=Saccharopolyspora spinosa TaxID=60894 RepID=UPI00376F3156
MSENELSFTEAAEEALSRIFATPRAETAITDRTAVDTIACIAGGRYEPFVAALAEARRVPPRLLAHTSLDDVPGHDAAFVNAAAAHSQDLDDTQLSTTAHVSSVVWSTLLAVVPSATPGLHVARAATAGHRFLRMLGGFVVPNHLRAGWHATGTASALGAVVAYGALVDDHARTRRALGIVGSLMGGLRANNMSSLKCVHAGRAAENALLAHRIAVQESWAGEASLPAMAAAFGFRAAALRDDTVDGSDMLAKLYPSCSGTHPAVEVVLSLRAELSRRGTVDVTVPQLVADETTTAWPAGIPEARMSLPYTIACALHYGRLDNDAIRDGLIEPAVRAAFDTVVVRVDAEDQDTTYQPWARVDLPDRPRTLWSVPPDNEAIGGKWARLVGPGVAPPIVSAASDVRSLISELRCAVGVLA